MFKEKGNSKNSTACTGQVTRRDFIRRSTVAAAAVALGGATLPLAAVENAVTVNGLPASILGRTGLKVTKISLGGAIITDPRLLQHVIDQGINFVHTASNYENGRSIETFGKVFKIKGYREKVVLALKDPPDKIDECLKMMNTDHVDIVVPPLTSIEEISDPRLPDVFRKAKEAGKIRYLGWAGHANTTEMFEKGMEVGWFDATLMAYSNIKDPKFLAAARKANKAGIGIFTMKGLPKRNADGTDPELAGTVATLCKAMLEEQYAHSVLASMSTFQSVEFFRGLMEKNFGQRNMELEERYWAMQTGSYCAMCGACEKVCPEARDYVRAVRYRMYYRDYGLKEYARMKYASLNGAACRADSHKVALCESVCPRRLPLARMLADAETILS
jgi:predicted aldo/keto reductase-like oxidoreductase